MEVKCAYVRQAANADIAVGASGFPAPTSAGEAWPRPYDMRANRREALAKGRGE